MDLSNGLPCDTQSLHSAVTPFQSTSNTVEDLAKFAPGKTEIVLITCDAPFSSSSKENVKDDGLQESEAQLHVSPETVPECNTSTENVSVNDSCVGSSIAGEMSTELHTSTMLYSSDASNASLGNSNNTSSNSEYIPTVCASKISAHDSQSSPPGGDAMKKQSVPLSEHKHQSLHLSTVDDDDMESNEAAYALPAYGRKSEAKTKDYIHATNVLCSVVDSNLPNTAEF